MMPELVEYLTVWNGVHADCDADLLDRTLIVGEKRHPEPDVDQPKDRALVITALTAAQLRTLTGLSSTAIHDQLYVLRRQGFLKETETGRKLSGGRMERVYGLRQAVTVQGDPA